MKNICLILASIVFLAFFPNRIQAAPGDLDPTFGVGGKIIQNNGLSVNANAAAVQADNKIVVAGGNYLARFTSNGLPDQSFGNSGYVTVLNHFITDVKVQTDGKIVVTGAYWDFVYTYLTVWRFNTNGTYDFSYTASLPSSTGNSLAIQADGKLVVGGYVWNGSSGTDFLAMRFNTNGTLDTTFSGNGIFTAAYNFNNASDEVNSVAIEPTNGKILLVGFTVNASTGKDFALMRLNSNGSLDTSFGLSLGRTSLNFSGQDDVAYDVLIQPGGKIIAAGSARVSNPLFLTNTRFALARFNSNGSLDTSFGSGGKVTTSFGNLSNDVIQSIALQSNGRIVAAGYQGELSNQNNFALARYNTNGTLDTSFSGSGKLTTDFYGDNDVARAIVLQSDGKIVAVGGVKNANEYSFGLARYLP